MAEPPPPDTDAMVRVAVADLGVGARRISPSALRGLIGFSARAARVIARTIGSGKEGEV